MSSESVVYICSKELVKVKAIRNIIDNSLIHLKVSSLLPSNKGRSTVVHSLISSIGLMNPFFSNTKHLQVITPSKASYKDLSVYHSRDYLDTVLDRSPGAIQASNVAEFGLEDV